MAERRSAVAVSLHRRAAIQIHALYAAIAIGAVFGFQRIYLGQWTGMRGVGHEGQKASGS